MFLKSTILILKQQNNFHQKLIRTITTTIKIPERRQDFAKLTKDDIFIFQNLLGENNVKTNEIDE